MSLASLPHNIPFNLGGLIRPQEIKAHGFTGVLPKGLPFTLSARASEEQIPYGSLGWQLICRAHDDFQTELLRTSDFTAMSFSRELNALGAASFTLNLEHPLFKQTLANGYSVETLFDYENLWELRFDNKIRFQCLGTAVVDSQVSDSETRTATVTGSGIAKVLEWGVVFPSGFPDNILTKLETLKDEFTGERLNTSIWRGTLLNPGTVYTSLGAKQEAVRDIETYTAEKEQLTQSVANAQQNYNEEKADYAAVMKDKTSTAAEKKEATKQLNAAKKELDTENKKYQVNQERLNWATARNAFYPWALTDETSGHVRLALNSAGFIQLTSGQHEFKSSGISAAIEVAPTTLSSTGQAHTGLKVTSSIRDYARIYSARINGQLRLVAEVSSNDTVVNEDWDFQQSQQKYWRIREDQGEIVFETSPDNALWTQRFRFFYDWEDTSVSASFQLEIIGNPGISFPAYAYMYDLNASTLPGTETSMALFRQLLEETQSRGVIDYVTLGFTDEADSRGLAWVGEPSIDIPEGTKLSQALNILADLQQADWLMDNNFNLKVYQRTKEDETIPPVFFRKEDVVFHEGGSQISKSRTRNRGEVANFIVGKNAAGQYSYTEDADSAQKYQKREAFISAGNATSIESLAAVLESTLQQVKEEKTSWTVVVDADQPGRRVFEDYDVGDWISIENIDSSNHITISQWRVVGIAVQIPADGNTVVELTLQSRMELLAERLKSEVDKLSSSTTGSATTLGQAVSADALIRQMTLSGLSDVLSLNPVEGDVLTYSNGVWIPAAPGDKTIPNTPEILSSFSNIYFPFDGETIKAQLELSWTLPTNTDGSVITDGHHFEIRYRPDTSADYPSTWAEAGQLEWDELYTWGQPTIPPITNSGWQTVYVGFDETSTVIQELTPGVNYEIQIRAVDSSTPQHFSEWSETYVAFIARDTIAPPTPAAPIVASSLLGIQVQHFLGRADGGTFNLPSDMAYLEVHVGGPSFYPDETTRIGKIVADQGLIRSGTPVIQTFQVESTENIWVRVIAVDKAGNRSGPSGPATSIANLIDDAHISDLTASKITAGTISSSIILGGEIKTADSGPRAEMNFEGFRIFSSEDDDPSVSLLSTPAENGNFLLIKDPADLTATLAGIDGEGRGSFQSITVAEDITIQGEDLLAETIYPRAKGVIAIGTYGEPYVGGGPAVERGFLEISFIAEESRTYMICAVTEFESTVSNERITMRLRDGGEDEPTLALPWIQQAISPVVGGAQVNAAAQIIYAGTFTPGLHRILWSFFGQLGNVTVNPVGASQTAESTTLIWVEDVGLPKTDTVIVNDAGVPEQSAPVPDPGAPAKPRPKPKVEYTKNYSCTWSGTYRSNGGYSSSHGNLMVQGNSGDGYLGDARGLAGFDYKQIMRDTAGAQIKACYITLYANHWWENNGGTARIGTHNYTGKPGSISGGRLNTQRVSSSKWPKPGKRKVSLGTTIGNEFKSGAAKGIVLGPTNDSHDQYGRFNGNGQSKEPILTIVYVK